MGCYGHKRIQTPHLDRLARQGIRFTQFYVNGSVCSPTRGAFLTSRFPAELGWHGHLATAEQNKARAMPNWLDPKLPTVPRLLQGAGYQTGHYGKWHLGGGPNRPEPSAYGFDQWRIAEGPDWNLWAKELRARSTELIVDETVRFIEQHKDGPFYVQAWLLDTHATLQTTDAQMDPYKNLVEPQVPFKSAGQIYYGAATDADHHLGRLFKRLDELGLAQNTLVIFSPRASPQPNPEDSRRPMETGAKPRPQPD